MEGVESRFIEFQKLVPEGVKLVAVSKYHTVDEIREVYEMGQRCFGESRVKDLLEKIEALPKEIEWHFIGHIQTNKLRPLIGKTALIQSVDSERLLALIDTESRKAGVTTRVLLQVHVAQEETKFGFTPDELRDYFRQRGFESLTNTHICGLMAMATNTDDENRVRADFRTVADLMREVKTEIAPELRGFDTLSMGMSGDWPLAVEEGANMIRVGSAIFS